jgi:hypothetical protein
MDFVGSLPVTPRGNGYILVLVDYNTRWPLAFPLPEATAAHTAQILVEHVFLQYGISDVILSDKGPHFTDELLAHVLHLFQTRHVFSSGHRPQTAGLVERFNRTLLDLLAKFVELHQTDWDLYLPYVLYAYRTTYNPAVGHTPFYLLYGYEARGPETFFELPPEVSALAEQERNRLAGALSQARALARANLHRAQERLRQTYDQRAHQAVQYQPGDLVLAYAPRIPPGGTIKLAALYDGPFRIESILPGNKTCKLVRLSDGHLRLAHVDNIKHYNASPLHPLPGPIDHPPVPTHQEEQRAIEALRRQLRTTLHTVDPARVRASVSDLLQLAAPFITRLPPDLEQYLHQRAPPTPPPPDPPIGTDTDAHDPDRDLVNKIFRRGAHRYKVVDVYTDATSGQRATDFRLYRHQRLHGPTRWADPTEVRQWVEATANA